MAEILRAGTLEAKPVLSVSEKTRQAIAEADKAYEAAHRPLYDEYAAALRQSDEVVATVKLAFRDRFEALRSERTRAVKAAYAAEVRK